MTPAYDILSFTLSIPFNQPTSSTSARVLGWRFYNSKNSISNKSTSSFKRITIRSLLQWLQDLVLNKTFATIFRPISLENKMSLPAPKTQQKDQILAMIRLLLFPRLLPLLRLLLHFLFSPPRTSSQNS